ncbi:hypothetical protein AA313_de0204029 [Arthrobotrys entomopaga]|nr:hypothetical protein AA313_de0204029 [Arthrobotrys entomopaga]
MPATMLPVPETAPYVWANANSVIVHQEPAPQPTPDDITELRIPDLYKLVMDDALSRRPNPLLEQTHTDIINWVCETLQPSEKGKKIFEALATPFVCAVMMPNGSEQPLMAFNEWMVWILFFDDRVDNGMFRENVALAAEEMIWTLAILDEDQPPIPASEDGVRRMFQQMWGRIKAVSFILRFAIEYWDCLYGPETPL